MKGRAKTTVPRIHLIAEDRTGEIVFREIVRKKHIAVQVIPYGKAVGVSMLAKEIKGLIWAALQESTGRDCIIVLHDTDTSVESYREHYKTIERVCNLYPERVTRLEAVQEIEAWLLADAGFCKWLDEKPRASDHIPQPSKTVQKMVNDKFGGAIWTNLNKPRILRDHMDATGETLSSSMRKAMDTFQQLPCARRSGRGS